MNREIAHKWRNILLIFVMASNLMALMGENIEENYVIAPSKLDDNFNNFLHMRLGIPTVILLLNVLPAWCLSIMQQIEIKTTALEKKAEAEKAAKNQQQQK